METFRGPPAVSETRQPETTRLTNRNAAAVRRPEADMEQVAPSQKEIEREQRWAR